MERKNTAEKYYGYSFKVMLIAAFATLACCLLPVLLFVTDIDSDSGGVTALIACAVITGLIFLVPAIYFLVQYLYYKNVALEDVQKVLLARTSTTRMRQIGFVIEVEQGGIMREVTTKRVFSADKVGPTKLDDYCGQLADVGYNPDRDEYVVLVKE